MLNRTIFSLLDFKVGLRMLARYPGLTIVSTVAISVAIALGSVYFEAINKFRNPVVRDRNGAQVIEVMSWDVNTFKPEGRVLHEFSTWRDQVRTITDLGAAVTFVRNLGTDDERIETVKGAEVTANAFRLMGTAPLLGRTLIDQDENPAGQPVAVISHSVWKSHFAGDPSVLGRTAKLGTTVVTIVGVMPEGFGFPVNQRIWTPLRVNGASLAPRSGLNAKIFGRLQQGATLNDARAELGAIGARLATTYPETHRHLRMRVVEFAKPLAEGGEMKMIMGLMYVVNVVFVLLLTIVCANVATLVFARTATRGWEMTVRSALGASRARIIGQLFIEAFVLAFIGTVVGLMLAKVAISFGLGLLGGTDTLPFWIDDTVSWKTVVYAGLLTLFGAAIVGILPALRITRVNIQDALRSESAGRAGLRFGGFWTTVIVLQVAITVAFLPLAAGGVFESNRFKQRAEGIGAENYLAAELGMDRESHAVDSAAHALRARQSLAELERRLSAEPGVQHVAFASRLPVEDQFKYRIDVDTTTGVAADLLRVSTLVQVSSGFFRAFGTSVVTGRDFEPLDFETGRVLIVNEAFARHVLGGRNPIGQRVRIVQGEDMRGINKEEWFEVVGMVRNFGWQLPQPQEQSAMYRPVLPTPAADLSLALRVQNTEDFGNRLRAIASEVDPTIRLTEVQPLGKVGGGEARMNWALTSVAWLVSFIVLLLSATGIHALMSFTVARRTREISIRAALGAHPGRIVREIFSRALLQITAGIVVGSVLAVLMGVESTRGVMLLLAANGVMLVVGLTACAIPVRRALRIDPTEALRAEG